ncbi:hypothetical protein [Kamptonema sp. UHCC 0994]|uniref:DUF7005 family protein n=1 Tax=Kamptonema sp. UHCC 0994 TaxID=3031329 RepID=UPI0023B8A0BD|nr:hypothetical protein [Kamptonema sp. UHCC 0994]MDF0556031.1 hypothetical protein [Kamptonema sp. UHCC 0994]
MSLSLRTKILTSYGATPLEIEELLAYNDNVFAPLEFDSLPTFPLMPESYLTTWETYLTEAEGEGVFTTLRSQLVQLQFPILAGISETENYRLATRKGYLTATMPEATGLVLQQPETLKLILHESLAGKIPILIAGCREDFIALVQALVKRNEPVPIPNSMGAVMVAGYNNWDRVRTYRTQWESQQLQFTTETAWQAEFKQLIPQKDKYQDRFIILSPGGYSGVTASDMGMSELEWLPISLTIRLEHECTHYFTRRLLGSMRNNLMDELIADYRGIIAANNGNYRADWFLRFLGLEAYPEYRQGGRMENYRGEPPLSAGAFQVLHALVKDAAENLEQFHTNHIDKLSDTLNQGKFLIALTRLTLEELANTESSVLSHLLIANG